MDMICQNCNEPWDLYGIIHEEGGLEAIDSAPLGEFKFEFNGFEIEDICGREEIPEGHFLFNRCPCCSKPGAEVERPSAADPFPLGEVITDPDLDSEDRKALALALVS